MTPEAVPGRGQVITRPQTAQRPGGASVRC